MKILLSIDTDKNINALGDRLSKILNLFDEDVYYVDVFHAYEKPKADAPHLPYTMTEIIKEEQKLKMRFIADCQHLIDNLLEEKLHKTALVNSYLKEGKYFKEFQAQMREEDYDLIVLLPDKKDKLETFFQGRNITKIIEKHRAPILVLPKTTMIPMEDTNFIAMVDDTKKATKKVQKQKVIQKIRPGHLKFYHICDVEKEASSDEVNIVQNKNVMQGFAEIHNNRKANHIYIVRHKRKKGMQKFMKSSFTKGILKSNDASMMIL